ncbi:MAG: TatD family hydrolase [Microscillaceae bacterium]|jgi:TatD DNase family protein|nr:TatD family hydrolase [Microscillaceae bacterium]
MYHTDTHTHLYLEQFAHDRAEMLQRALEAQVTQLYLPNIDSESIDDMLELEAKYPQNCYAMMGLHPCSVKADFEKELYIVEDWLNQRPFAAVGEMGTDLYWDKTFFAQQQEAFKIQVQLAKKHQLPIVIHCRESFAETVELLKPLIDKDLTGIFHCFTGSLAEARQVIEMGFYLGIGGVVSYKNGGLDKVLPEIPLDFLVLETDSPYLSPVPYRGKRNESSYLPIIAQKIADMQGISLTEVQAQTTANAQKIFKNKDSIKY